LTTEQLTEEFNDAGIERGDSILVHSSLSSLGWVDGGADAVVDALIEAVGDEGTVLFPTLTGSPDNSREHPPIFDARSTRCWTGAIPEAARQRPDAPRSLHPTHSASAIGKLARWFTTGHELVHTPCGFGSPYDKLADIGGKIVLIGVTQSSNTSFHSAEEIAGVPYVLRPEPLDVTLTDADGNSIEMRETCIHLWGAKRDYNIFEDPMIDLGICQVSRVGNAEVRIIDAMLQRMFLLRKLLEDPLATLDITERRKWQ